MGDELVPDAVPVGAAAARLGIAPETLRSWGRRYGLVPSARTAGGHRRYSHEDLAQLVRMQRLVGEGHTPADAAREVRTDSPAHHFVAQKPDPVERMARPIGRRGGPGGRVLAVPDGSPEARGLARAASRLDADAIGALLGDHLVERGTIATWDEVLRPVLVAVGVRWARTGEGIDTEHMLTEATIEALRAHRACQLRPLPGRPVLLACSADDLHAMPLHVIAAALAERRVPIRVLGTRVPPSVLAAALRRTGASAVFIWRQLVTGLEMGRIDLPRTRPPVRLVVGGPGWDGVELTTRTTLVASLAEAVDVLSSTPR